MIVFIFILLFIFLQPGSPAAAADVVFGDSEQYSPSTPVSGAGVAAPKNRDFSRIKNDDDSPTVQLISPSGWEEWEMNSWQPIRWEASDDQGLRVVSLELSRDKITWVAVFHSEKNLVGERDTIVKVLHDTCDVCWPRIVVIDSSLNTSYDTALSPILVVNEPAITVFPADSAKVGKPYGFKITYRNPLDGSADLTFGDALPVWVRTQGDSVFGIPEGQSRIDTITAFLAVDGVAYDTLDLAIRIFGSAAAVHGRKPAQESLFRMAISRMASDEYWLHIAMPTHPVQITLFDLAGKSLHARWLHGSEHAVRLPASIPNGVYILSAQNVSHTRSWKVTLFR